MHIPSPSLAFEPAIHSPLNSRPRVNDTLLEENTLLLDIIRQRKLSAVFQPILNLHTGELYGYEGLIRGPEGSALHAPSRLFEAAARNNLLVEVEMLCRQIVLKSYVALKLPGKLFMNVSPQALLHPSFRIGCSLHYIDNLNLPPERVVLEITENQPTIDFDAMRSAILQYRKMGFQIAIDDLGQGFSSLRLWSELRPEFIKIDMHFIRDADSNPVKRQFLRSIQHIAESCNTHVIAEGIETNGELNTINEIAIMLGQGYFICPPLNTPPVHAPSIAGLPPLKKKHASSRSNLHAINKNTTEKLLRFIEPVSPDTDNRHILERFNANPKLRAIPVVQDGKPVGLINRYSFFDCFVKPYQKELLGNKPCRASMHETPLLVEKSLPIEELGNFLADADESHFNNGFIITDNGRYLGFASGQDLLRELTQMQIEAARYANPLTLLPGNVPINNQIEQLLHSGKPFYACYCDLDHFKPFNDIYGYLQGDEMIQLAGRILSWSCDPKLDFIGHIGGDDFILLMQSRNFQTRCEQALRSFEQAASLLFKPEHIAASGYTSTDRNNQPQFHPLVSLSIGVCLITPAQYTSHHEVSAAASAAKKIAKQIPGNSLFIEQRKHAS